MKIDRLIGILSILLQLEKVTAPYLAEKFEVSRRTISRDIEAICTAGIPIVTTQGKNGGISIMDGYRIDRTLLTSFDMQAILSGLGGLDSVSGTKNYQRLMEKLRGEPENTGRINQKYKTGSDMEGDAAHGRVSGLSCPSSNDNVRRYGPIRIDLASWYKKSLAPKIELLRRAIERREQVRFDYFAPGGESSRLVEPCLLVFHWAAWYVWGYCMEREGFRLFKLNRVQNLVNAGEIFEPREMPEPDWAAERIFPSAIPVEVAIAPQMKWRLIDDYGPDSFTEREDGRLIFQWAFADKEGLFGWLLSFAGQAELQKPVELRLELAELMRKMAEQYRCD